MASLKDLIVKIGADTRGLEQGVDDAKSSLAGLTAAGEGLVAVGAGLSAGLTAPIVAMGMAALTAGGQMEQARMSFETMLGSAEKSASFLKDLENFAKTTPFEFSGLVTSSKQMLAFGFAAADIIPNLTAVGDAIAAVGGGEEAIQGVIRALGQMSAKGKVSAEEINQMAERGINAWKYLAAEAGVSIAEVQKLAEQGALNAGVAIKTIIAGMGAEFGGLMAKQSQTLMGQISNLQDTFGQSLTRLGEALIPFATQAVALAAQMADAFSGAVDVFTNLSPPVQSAVVAIAGLAAAVGPLVAGIGGLMVAWGTLGPAITAAGATMAAVATGPVGITVAAIAGLAAAGYALADQFGVLDPIIAAVGSVMDTVGSAISAVVSNFQPLIVGIGLFAGELLTANPLVAALAGWVGDKLVWAFEQIGTVIKNVVMIHLEALGAVFGWLAEKAQALFGFFVEKGQKALGDTGKSFKDAAADTGELSKKLDEATASAKKTEPAVSGAAGAALVLATKAKAAKIDVFDLDKSMRALEATNKEAERIAKAAAEALAKDMGGAAVDLKVDIEAVTAATQVAMTTIAGWTQTAATNWDSVAMQAATTAAEVDAAFSAMGIKTKAQLEQAATDAAHNFDLIAGSGQASATAIDTAWIQMLEARKAALQANGTDLGVEEQKILDDLLARQKTHATDSKTVWQTWSDGIKDLADNLDIGGKIFSGDFSPSKWKETLKGIAEDFLNVFIQPLKDSINDFIAGGLKNLSGALSGIGSQGSQVVGGLGGSTGSGLGGGGGLAAAGGLFNQVTGAITAGASVADAILSHFGRKRAEATANAIEENTRTHMLLFADYRQSVGFFQNDELQEQTANLEYIVGNGDAIKEAVWKIRDILAGGVAVSAIAGSAVSDLGTTIATSTRDMAVADTPGMLRMVADAVMGTGPSRARSNSQINTPTPGSFTPTRARDGQPLPTAEDIGNATRDALAARNPLAVIAAELGNPLAQLATGSNFMPAAIEAQTTAIETTAASQEAATTAQTEVIRTTADATDTRLSMIYETLQSFVTEVRTLLNRDIVLNIDGQEIARAVGAGQEALRATA